MSKASWPWHHLPSNEDLDAYLDVGFDLHEFLKAYYDQFPEELEPTSLAHIAHLIQRQDFCVARKLLASVRPANRQYSGLALYLSFHARERQVVQGRYEFDRLDEEDVFLAACYCSGNEELRKVFNQISDWRLESVLNKLGNDRTRNIYKTFGLQPRIAELVYYTTYCAEADTLGIERSALRDENLHAIKGLPVPWSLRSVPSLPSCDWRSVSGLEYDVKSNVYLRSKPQCGLSGFFIKPGKREVRITPRIFPGIVFYASDKTGCSWSYVGEYDPERLPFISSDDDRVAPFFFRVPDENRCVLSEYGIDVSEEDFQCAWQLLRYDALRFGWCLACRRKPPQPFHHKFSDLFLKVVEAVLREPAQYLLEYRLWKAVTFVTMEAGAEHAREDIDEFLKLIKNFCLLPSFPIRFSVVGNECLMRHWIDSVLLPVNEHVREGRCPDCDTVFSQAEPRIMTCQGTIKGVAYCGVCGKSHQVTLIAHCIECGKYPLLLGRNELCGECNSLRCDVDEVNPWSGKRVVCHACLCESGKSPRRLG